MRLAILILPALLAATTARAETQLTPEDRQEIAAVDESMIVDCVAAIARARAVMARERQVGAVSGYVDRQTLHAAGESIVNQQARIQMLYQRYRREGGTKTLAQIIGGPRKAAKPHTFDY